jgi:hypothetical protein
MTTLDQKALEALVAHIRACANGTDLLQDGAFQMSARRTQPSAGEEVAMVTDDVLSAAVWSYEHAAENSDLTPQDCMRAAINAAFAVSSSVPTEGLPDQEKSAAYSNAIMERALGIRKYAATLIGDAEMLESVAYDTAEYCGGGEP